jgi:hypothetical protein
MKTFTPIRRSLVLCWISVAAWAQMPAVCDAAAPPTETVTIKDDVVLIHPGTEFSKADRKALNDILSKYDKSLYKIEIYKDGKVTRTQGKLSDVLIDKALAAEATDAKAKGNSNRTLQIIAATSSQQLLAGTTGGEQAPGAIPSASTNPQRILGGTPTPAPNAIPSASTNPQRIPRGTPTPAPGAPTHPQRPTAAAGDKTAQELIERLKPILEKYSSKK